MLGAHAARDRQALLNDSAPDFVVIGAIPRDRAQLAIPAMRLGKDVMVDKPGVTTAEDLTLLRRAVAETGRIWSVALERLMSRSVQAALCVARSGEIGTLVHLTHLAPHRLNCALHQAWFFDKATYGGTISGFCRRSARRGRGRPGWSSS